MTTSQYTKPYSQACENNKNPILEQLQILFQNSKSVLEIGSGTGQHAVHFAGALPHLQWQTSDRSINHAGINAWIDEADLTNIKRPIALDVTTYPWPPQQYDAIYSANTAHIMPWPAVQIMLTGVAKTLEKNGLFVLYGPFNYGGKFTSDSNARFDIYLKNTQPHQGIRDFEAIDTLAREGDLIFKHDFPLPANNHLLVWRKA